MLPALVALTLKLIVVYLVDTGKQSSTFVSLFVTLTLLNLCEVLAYIQFTNDQTAFWLLKAYYVVCLYCLCYLTLYAVEVAVGGLRKSVSLIFIGFASLLAVGVLSTDLFLIGTKSIGYSLTAVHGPYFPLIRFVFIAQTCLFASVLAWGLLYSKNAECRDQAMYTLICLSPIILTALSVNVVQAFGIELSNSMIMPFATTVFLFLVCYFEPKSKLTRIRMYLPRSRERKLTKEVFDLATEFALEGKSIQDVKTELERALLLYSLEKNGNVITRTADSIGINRTSLYTAMKRLGIKHRD